MALSRVLLYSVEPSLDSSTGCITGSVAAPNITLGLFLAISATVSASA